MPYTGCRSRPRVQKAIWALEKFTVKGSELVSSREFGSYSICILKKSPMLIAHATSPTLDAALVDAALVTAAVFAGAV